MDSLAGPARASHRLDLEARPPCAMIALPALCGAAPGEIVRLRRNDSGVHGARQSTMVNAAVRRAAGHSAPPKASRCADTSVRMARSVSDSTSLVRTPTYTNIYDRRRDKKRRAARFQFSWACISRSHGPTGKPTGLVRPSLKKIPGGPGAGNFFSLFKGERFYFHISNSKLF